jgi:hypothetical protein
VFSKEGQIKNQHVKVCGAKQKISGLEAYINKKPLDKKNLNFIKNYTQEKEVHMLIY